MKGVKFAIDRKVFTGLAADLRVAEEAIARAQYRAINKVANKTMTRSRREIVSQVNLTQTYVREKMHLYPATRSNAQAVIVARVRPTRLTTYGAKQAMAKAKGKSRGDKLRGIPAGKKQAGVSVAVKRGGSRKTIRNAFLLPLRAGKVDGGNGMGVFWRYGKDIEQDYGPSVDQVFRNVIPQIDPEVRNDIAAEIEKQTTYELRKALKA